MTEHTPTDPLADLIAAHDYRASLYECACQDEEQYPDTMSREQWAAHLAAVVRASGTTTERVPRTCTACGTPEGAAHGPRCQPGYAWQINRPAASGVTPGGATREPTPEQIEAAARAINPSAFRLDPSNAAALLVQTGARAHARTVLRAGLRPAPAPDDQPAERPRNDGTRGPLGPHHHPVTGAIGRPMTEHTPTDPLTDVASLDALTDTDARVIDRHGDIWQRAADGRWYTPETAPFDTVTMLRKFGPLRRVAAVVRASDTTPTDLAVEALQRRILDYEQRGAGYRDDDHENGVRSAYLDVARDLRRDLAAVLNVAASGVTLGDTTREALTEEQIASSGLDDLAREHGVTSWRELSSGVIVHEVLRLAGLRPAPAPDDHPYWHPARMADRPPVAEQLREEAALAILRVLSPHPTIPDLVRAANGIEWRKHLTAADAVLALARPTLTREQLADAIAPPLREHLSAGCPDYWPDLDSWALDAADAVLAYLRGDNGDTAGGETTP